MKLCHQPRIGVWLQPARRHTVPRNLLARIDVVGTQLAQPRAEEHFGRFEGCEAAGWVSVDHDLERVVGLPILLWAQEGVA